MPQWAGSCWYYLRFLSPDRDDVAWDAIEERYWSPVDLYVGGSEPRGAAPAVPRGSGTRCCFDAGLVHTKEPFQRLVHQGMIHKTSFRDATVHYRDNEVEPHDSRKVAREGDRRRRH